MDTATREIQLAECDRFSVKHRGYQWLFLIPTCVNCGERCRWAFPGWPRMRFKCECGFEGVAEAQLDER